MQWITPSEKDTATDTLGKRLWDAADQFRANYLWVQLFHFALNERGRADFVMANSASDARPSANSLLKSYSLEN